MLAWSTASLPGLDSAGRQQRPERAGHEAVDQLTLLHDGNRMSFADPAHAEFGLVDLASRPEENGILPTEQEGSVE